ncbi:2OG-Fe(II) oxygenase [Myxosarcina sp. GI1]|uniref:2OG-Fe(II) oxygenase n=1 Tax=Myxosarcina sp. GI1 TaxID=1541065 RepID=UPI00155AC68B|nr:2OG-Fe(II) oxygenase [Myxosarcina sp. GI1]
MPKLNSEDLEILKTLKKDGIYITSIEKLGLPFSNIMFDSAISLAEQLSQIRFSKNKNLICNEHSVSITTGYLANFPEIFLWALETKLLNLVENYIGLPVIYQGLAIRRDFTDGKQADVRKWHLDWEDRHTIKVIIYLNDVDVDGGPLEHIHKDSSFQAIKTLNYYNLGYLSDDEMMSAIPKSQWQTCIGNAGTLIVIDTSIIFHRASPPINRERFSLTFCYTSDRPKVMWTCRQISQKQWQSIEHRLDERQKKCLSKK